MPGSGPPAAAAAGAPRRRRGFRLFRPVRAAARLLARALRHPIYAASVAWVLLSHPRLVGAALRRGWRAALLAECARRNAAVAACITAYEAGFFGQVVLFDEYEVGRMRLSRRPRVCDVGANVGLFTWRVAELHPEADIVAVEPAAENWRRLDQVVAAAGIRARTVHGACGAEAGRAVLHLHNSVTHSLLAEWHAADIGGGATEEVDLVTVDGVCDGMGWDGLDLLKIDVEGAEALVLEGASGILPHCARVVLEYHSPELGARCEHTLSEAGFRCRHKRFWGLQAGGGQGEGLLLCVRPGPTPPAPAGS